jgi:hypothetical protein
MGSGVLLPIVNDLFCGGMKFCAIALDKKRTARPRIEDCPIGTIDAPSELRDKEQSRQQILSGFA